MMHYRELGNTGRKVSILGMGAMRLPVIDGDNGRIDEDRAIALIRQAIDGGVNYIDTAYPYHEGLSEALVGKALAGGYRERVTLVTKCPVWLIEAPEDFDRYLDEQLERLQTDSIDIYHMHALGKSRWERINTHDFQSFVERAKASGKIKHIGFSFHDDAETFEDILTGYPWEVCMIQFNYVDQDVQATIDGLRLAGERGVPVIVMEPLKGGLLANPPEDILATLNGGEHTHDAVEWALRWVGQFPEVKVVLSGMSDEEQVAQNLMIAEKNLPGNLTDDELTRVASAKAAFDARVKVPCTDCKYCMPCPYGVDIPENFKRYNRASIFDTLAKEREAYASFDAALRADQCRACGACEPQCPQQIPIIEALREVHSALAE